MEVWQDNREKKKEPKQGRFWCYNCDADVVKSRGKCSNCGHKNYKHNGDSKRNKK